VTPRCCGRYLISLLHSNFALTHCRIMAKTAFNVLNSENKSRCILWWIHSGPFCLFSSCRKPSQKHFQFVYTLKLIPNFCTPLPQIFYFCPAMLPDVTFDLNTLHIVPIQVSVMRSVLNVR